MKKLLCKVVGHQFTKIDQKIQLNNKYSCTCCKQKFITDGYGQFIKLNHYWEENDRLFEMHFLGNRKSQDEFIYQIKHSTP